MAYVYFLQSVCGKYRYTGMTGYENVLLRLDVHNKGSVPSTRQQRPWNLQSAIWVETEAQAKALEAYFKQGSGHAWASKRLFTSPC